MDVEGWLRLLGMEQYASAFRDNAIDAEVLPRLTAEDLKDIGVAAVGHRRKLLDAIAGLGPVPATFEVAAAAAPPRAKDEAERRPITVMFCDLVGSTSMAAVMEAEDWRDLVGSYLDEAAKAVTLYGGHVLKKLGDGLMALFGYPKAQENDAERAARAGLAILRALEDLNEKNAARGLPVLAARIGLQSGPVVVDSSGEVFGDAPNVAARVQAAAEPGTLFVTALVQRQLAGFFVAEDKGPHDLKGVPGKPVLFRLVRASGGGRKVGARSLTPLVGRDEELATLTRRWERAKAGDGQFLQIVGEPGLGKSRLVDEFHARLAETPHTWVEWSSSQLLQNTPLHPLAEWGRQRFVGEAKFVELEAALAQVKLDPSEHAPLLASLLDISTPDGRAPQVAADELRRKQLMAVVAWILAGARTQPLVLAFEDLHWADPTTLDLMKTLTERGGQSSLLIVATARPEFRAPWTTRSHHSVISLSPLDRAQIGQMVAVISARHALSRDVVEGLSDRTAGVPLFIEELTRLMLEGGAQTVPPTLQQLLAARLDRLGNAREVAQIGAVLGREFSHALLASVADMPGSALEAALEKLTETDLLFVDGVASAATYRFKHALIQDSAYDSLLKSRRQALHRRAAEALAAAPDAKPEPIAHHFTQGGVTERAIDWWEKAGVLAMRNNAVAEASNGFSRALSLVTASAMSPNLAERELSIRLSLGPALLQTAGYASHEVEENYLRAFELGKQAGRRTATFASLRGLWNCVYDRGDLARASDLAVGLEKVADTPAEIALAKRALGSTRMSRGEINAAIEEFNNCLVAVKTSAPINFVEHHGEMPEIVALQYGALCQCVAGRLKSSLELGRRAVAIAKAASHPWSEVFANGTLAYVLQVCGEFEESALVAEAQIEVSLRRGFDFWAGAMRIIRGAARAHLTGDRAALSEIEHGVIEWTASGAMLQVPTWHAFAGRAALSCGQLAAAEKYVAEGLAVASRNGELLHYAELQRLDGCILARVNLPQEARRRLAEALSTATAQGAQLYALRCATDLAKLFMNENDRSGAKSILKTQLNSFSESTNGADFLEANSLLAAITDEAVEPPIALSHRHH